MTRSAQKIWIVLLTIVLGVVLGAMVALAAGQPQLECDSGDFAANCAIYASQVCGGPPSQISGTIGGDGAMHCDFTCANSNMQRRATCDNQPPPVARCIFPACPPGCIRCVELTAALERDCLFNQDRMMRWTCAGQPWRSRTDPTPQSITDEPDPVITCVILELTYGECMWCFSTHHPYAEISEASAACGGTHCQHPDCSPDCPFCDCPPGCWMEDGEKCNCTGESQPPDPEPDPDCDPGAPPGGPCP